MDVMADMIAGSLNWIGNRLYAMAKGFWNRAAKIGPPLIRTSTTKSPEQIADEALTEAGFMPNDHYNEKWGK